MESDYSMYDCVRFALLSLLVPFISCEAVASPPNVVLILVDDLGWTDLGCYGSSFYDTPRLDKFAREAVRFTNAYAASPVCSPTRAAIMTGKNPARLHITDWIPGLAAAKPKAVAKRPLIGPLILNELPHRETTIAEALREQGYQTFFAGKWHLGGKSHWPQTQGFDMNWGGVHNGSPPGGYYSPYKNPQLSDGPDREYLSDRLTTEAIDFVNSRDASRPFFLCLWFYTVHTPIQGCEKYDAEYAERADKLPYAGAARYRREHQGRTRLNQSNSRYAAMVRSMDENVGRLLDALKQAGVNEETAIVFTSDNGGLTTTASGGPTAVVPLRAGKGWCYEGGIRVPLLIQAPGPEGPSAECSTPVVSTDLFPTILDFAEIPADDKPTCDGRSLIPLLRDPTLEFARDLVWHFPHYHGSMWTPGSAVRRGDWKLIEFYADESVELYNLRNDLSEQEDLAAKLPERAAVLRAAMHGLLKSMGADYPNRRDAGE